MTSQQASRKKFPSLTRESSIRPSVKTKASGDTNEKPRSRSKSKTKVPKSVRYDLENALVGLCDVWFEEIKPYLVRNNIKVHVHEPEGGRQERAAGDRDCSHLDPANIKNDSTASSAAACELCRLLFNAANSIESAVSQAASATATPTGPLPFNGGKENPCHNNYYETETKPRRRRHRRRASTSQSSPLQPVSRLCRTYSIQPQMTQETCPRRHHRRKIGPTSNHTSVLKRECPTTYVPTPKTKNKIIQTETQETLMVPEIKRERQIKPLQKTFEKQNAKMLERKNTTTTFYPAHKKETIDERGLKDLSPLFKDDLIDIIAEKNEQLQILYKGLVDTSNPSTMCLLPLNDSRKIPPRKKPWR